MHRRYFRLLFGAGISLLLAGATSIHAKDAASSNEPASAYLAAYFCETKGSDGKENSQLYYAISRDGFRFADAVNGNRSIVSATLGDKIIRDTMVMRDPDGRGFHLIATVSWKGQSLILFDSSDLIHWTNERVVQVSTEDADITWAPEMRWDPETKQYFAYWTSSVNHTWATAAIWYATSTDLKTFSAPQVLMREKGGCLDADILYAQGKWHMVYRYTGIWMRTADHAFGPYNNPAKILDMDVEGPFLFPVNAATNQWGLVFDYFGGNQGRWGVATSSDFSRWTLLTNKAWPYYTPDVFFPPGIRHGSVLPITTSEANSILKAYGSIQFDYQGHPIKNN